ncbi:MAG: hypothetical protein E6J32_03850 [Chloroflexi bacterium]|nr:MAG: hypothetical protein E6J32_03850 [Chloroflexota bacterium]
MGVNIPRRNATLYLAVFGSLQLAFLWVFRERFGVILPVLGLLLLVALLALLARASGAWSLKLGLLAGLIAITTFGPSVVAMAARHHTGLTFEYDGLAIDEVAVDRLIHGHAIYGVDWSGTQVAGYASVWGGVDLHLYGHLPLMPLSAVPVRLAADLLHLPFDYRMVVLLFSLIAMGAIASLPVPPPARFMVAIAILLNPALSLGAWTGHDDICYLAMFLIGLSLLGRRRLLLATVAFGIAAALKPFVLVVFPLLLVIIWKRSGRSARERGRDTAISAIAFGLPMLLSVGPFLIVNAPAFIHDIVIYFTAGLPIGGFGLGGLLVALHLVPSDARFSFAPLELAALLPAYWFGLRALARRPTMAQFLASYCLALFAILFFARYFADNYLAALVALVLCIPALGPVAFQLRGYGPFPWLLGRLEAFGPSVAR